MYLDGLPSVKLGSLQDRIRLSGWYRREQTRIFETLINVYANVISSNPEIIKKIESITDDYIEIIIPGSREFKKEATDSFIKKQSNALQSIFERMKAHADRTSGTPPKR